MNETPSSDAVTQVKLGSIKHWRSGKVRECFELGDKLLIVATDRISAFDVVLDQGIPAKGKILTQLSQLWFKLLSDIVPHHLLTTNVADFPPELQPYSDLLAERSMLCVKTDPLPVECVVRGYLVGSGWKDYQKTGQVCGIQLQPGLELASQLPQPIFTPSTKATSGHDENISSAEVANVLGHELTHELERVSLALYTRASEYARERGIILADTKFEFGMTENGLMLIDEVLTPDSSRFWPRNEWKPGANPPSFDKQFVRDYLETVNWNKEPPAPELPAEIIEGTARRYREIREILTDR